MTSESRIKTYTQRIGNTAIQQSQFTIGSSDLIFATAVQFGCILIDMSISGITSTGEAVATVAKHLEGVTGLVTINLRNRSQGTTAKRIIRLRDANATAHSVTNSHEQYPTAHIPLPNSVSMVSAVR